MFFLYTQNKHCYFFEKDYAFLSFIYCVCVCVCVCVCERERERDSCLPMKLVHT